MNTQDKTLVIPLDQANLAIDFAQQVANARIKEIAEIARQVEAGLVYPVEGLQAIARITSRT